MSVKAYNFHHLNCLSNAALRQGLVDLSDKLQAYFDLRNFIPIALFVTVRVCTHNSSLELHHITMDAGKQSRRGPRFFTWWVNHL